MMNEEELLRLRSWAHRVRHGALYEDFTLRADVDLGGQPWTPLGTPDNPYTGTFDGQGHTISGLHVEPGHFCGGFFGRLAGVAQDVHIVGTVQGDVYAGGIAGILHCGVIRRCSFRDAMSSERGEAPQPGFDAAGNLAAAPCRLVGIIYDGTVEDCSCELTEE